MERIELHNRKNQKIVGVLEKPDGKIKGTCIVEHGWGGSKEKPTVQAMKNGFLEAGFQTFNFDATNSFNESDGDFEKSTLGLHWEDLEDVVKWAQEQNWFVGPLALTGHSKGGYAVLRFAEEYPDKVSCVVSVAPVVSGELSFKAYEAQNPGGLEKWKTDKTIEVRSSSGNIRKQHWFQMEERLKHDLLKHVERLTMSILLIVGSEDTSCPKEHIKILYDKITSIKKEMKIIEGAPHSFNEAKDAQTCQSLILDWLKTI